MSLNCGIVGLPNVGKSTLFNTLTKSFSAQAENYPFCTIEPNLGTVVVEDDRLKSIAKITGSAKTIFNLVEIVDIAGLIKGASEGEGLGNKFLGHIREVDAIMHVIRCFDDEDVKHAHDKTDPLYDIEVIDYELMLADMASIERAIVSVEKKAKSNPKLKEDVEKLSKARELLGKGIPLRDSELSGEPLLKHLLTSKPMLFVCNVCENDITHSNKYVSMVTSKFGKDSVAILSVKLESEIVLMDSEEERKEFLLEYNLTESQTKSLSRSIYKLLNLITFFTAGPKEARAWSVKNGSTAKQSSGAIHSDFEKNFIRAEIISFEDYIENLGESGCKAKGKLRVEGKDYIVKDGDVVHFRIGA